MQELAFARIKMGFLQSFIAKFIQLSPLEMADFCKTKHILCMQNITLSVRTCSNLCRRMSSHGEHG